MSQFVQGSWKHSGLHWPVLVFFYAIFVQWSIFKKNIQLSYFIQPIGNIGRSLMQYSKSSSKVWTIRDIHTTNEQWICSNRVTVDCLKSPPCLGGPEKVIDFLGHVIGMALSPDGRYLYVNVRTWVSWNSPNFHLAFSHSFRKIQSKLGCFTLFSPMYGW